MKASIVPPPSCLAAWALLAVLAMLVPLPIAAQEPPQPLDAGAVAGMLEGGMAQDEILAAVEASGQVLDLTTADVELLQKAGAGPDLILALAGARVVPRDESLQPGTLTEHQVLKMHGSGVAPATVAGFVSRYGLSAPPDPADLVGYLADGVPHTIVRALAAGGRGSPDGAQPPELAGTILAVPAAALTAGEDGAILEEGPGDERLSPTPEEYDRLWVDSVPPGARVYLSPRGTYREESFRQAHAVGKTPLSLQLEPGDYQVTVVKQAGSFEESLLPAWRTRYDSTETRTILDNAHLVFDPDDCCLPTSLTGHVDISSIGRDHPGAIIGDQFGGLPPYLFDGEVSQILDVRDSRIRGAIKSYTIRKNPGQSRMLVATFLPAQGDSLDPEWGAGLGTGRPYAATLDYPGLEFLGTEEGIAGCAELLRVDAERMARAVEMLAQAGKTILDEPADKGRRIVSIALDDYGRLRLRDQTIAPLDLFSEPKKKSRKTPKPDKAAKTPLLPEVERVVVPGLGLPRLVVTNASSRAAALHFDDGQFFFVEAGATREVVVDPGTFNVGLLGGALPPGSPAGGRVHFAYHARYSLSIGK